MNNICFYERRKKLKFLIKNTLQKNWHKLLCATSVLLSLFIIGCIFFLLSRTYSVSLIVESDHTDIVKIYFDHPLFYSGFNERRVVLKEILPGKKRLLTFYVPQFFTKKLRIDPGEQGGVLKIYQMVIMQELGRKTVWSPEDIYSQFHCVDDSVDMVLEDDAVTLSFSDDDPKIVSNAGLLKESFSLFLLIPVCIASFFFYRYISRYSVDFFFSFFFPQRKQPSSKTSVIQPLDGLRGFATLLVVAEHTLHSFLGAGRSGVLIFFSLSGFLLARPYINSPEKLFSRESLCRYMQRRLERILPLYIVYLFIVYLVSFRFGEFLLHLLFIKGLGHLWTLPQEMLFYLVFPFILFINHFLLRNNIFLVALFLFSIILGWYYFVPLDKIYLYGMQLSRLPFMLPAFLSGTVFSYIYYKILINIKPSQKMKIILSTVAITIIFVFIFFSNAQLLHSSEIYAFSYCIPFGICAALLITVLIFTGETFLVRIFSNFFLTSIGVVSYGLYLFHPLVINFINKLHITGGLRFFSTFFISYFIACCTYRFIEAPLSTKRLKGKTMRATG